MIKESNLVPFEPPPRLDPFIENVLFDEALEYMDLHKDIGNSTNGGVERSISLITQAYFTGLKGKSEPQKITKTQIRKVINLGLQKRDQKISSYKFVIDQLSMSRKVVQYMDQLPRYEFDRESYAIEAELFESAKSELKNKERLVSFPINEQLSQIFEERKELIGELSSQVFKAWSNNQSLDKQSVLSRFLPDLNSQAMVIRGFLISVVNYPFSHKFDPLVITDNDLEILETVLSGDNVCIEEKMLNTTQYFKEVVGSAVSYTVEQFGLQNEIKDQLNSFFMDYLKQISRYMGYWMKTRASIDSQNIYTQLKKKFQILSGFPLLPFIPGEQFQFNLEEALSRGKDNSVSLWSNPVYDENKGIAIPSSGDIFLGLELLVKTGYKESDPEVKRLVKALSAWSTFQSTRTPGILKRIENDQAELDILAPVMSKSSEYYDASGLPKLNKLLRLLRQRNAYYEKQVSISPLALEIVKRPQAIVDFGDLNQELFEGRLVQKQARLHINNQDIEIRTHLLSRVDWVNFIYDDFISADYRDQESLIKELNILDKWEQEVRNRPRLVLPLDIERSPNRLMELLNLWIQDLENYKSDPNYWIKSNLLKSLDNYLKYPKAIRYEKFYYLRHQFLGDIEKRKNQLLNLSRIIHDNSVIQEELEQIYDRKITEDLIVQMTSSHESAFRNDPDTYSLLKTTVIDFFKGNIVYTPSGSGDDMEEVTIVHYLQVQEILDLGERINIGPNIPKLDSKFGIKQVVKTSLDNYSGRDETVLELLYSIQRSLDNPLLKFKYTGRLNGYLRELENRFKSLSAVSRIQKYQEVLAFMTIQKEEVVKTGNEAKQLNRFRKISSEKQRLENAINMSWSELFDTMRELKLDITIDQARLLDKRQ